MSLTVGPNAVGICTKTEKRQYATETDARRDAKSFRKKWGPRLRPYFCNKYCGFYHLGHDRPLKRRQEIYTKGLK